MKKNVLSLSIAAMIGGLGFVGAASAAVSVALPAQAIAGAGGTAWAASSVAGTDKFVVSPDGIGHVLLVPYYSTQEGNGTLLSIVNTDAVNGKAVKVRFRGASNSDDVFDFQVFLSPGDVWTANVYEDAATGLAKIFTPDNSCTLPRRDVLHSTPFKVDRVFGATAAAKAAETREGYVEIFNMADVPPTLPGSSATAITAGAVPTNAIVNPLYTAIKHTAAGTNPCGLAASDSALPAAILKLRTNPADTVLGALEHGFSAPTSGLTGTWTLINTMGASVAWSGSAAALEARTNAGVKVAGRVVFSPQMERPVDLATANRLTNDPLLRNAGATVPPIVAPQDYDLPDLSTPYLGLAAVNTAALAVTAPKTQADDITASIAVKSVANEFLTNPDISGQTDWIFSQPTRRYHVAVNYKGGATMTVPTAVFNSAVGTETAPSTVFTPTNTKMGTGGDPTYQACVIGATMAFRDQEERTAESGFVVSPGTSSTLRFCGEVTTLRFNGTSSLKAALTAKDVDQDYVDGWLNIDLTGAVATGLPTLGYSAVQMTGPVVAGKSTNFSITSPHRFTR